MSSSSSPPPPLIAPPFLDNPASCVTDHSHLFNSRNRFPDAQTAQLSEKLISGQNQELLIVEAETTEPQALITEQQQSRDLASLVTEPNPYDKLLSMFPSNQLTQEAETLDSCTPLKKPCHESRSLTSQSESPPDDEGLYGKRSSILNARFAEPPGPMTDSLEAGFPELYIEEEGDEPIRSSVFSFINDASTQEVEGASCKNRFLHV